MSSIHCIVKSNNEKPQSTIPAYNVEYVMVPTQLHSHSCKRQVLVIFAQAGAYGPG
jgi:hypothetical protein